MSEYIQWFTEQVFNKPFINKKSFNIWITQHELIYSNKNITYQLKMEKSEQMTIFDF